MVSILNGLGNKINYRRLENGLGSIPRLRNQSGVCKNPLTSLSGDRV